jgi:hypothetical protein
MGILLNRSKNYIINGAMDYWQRNNTFTAIADGVYCADRFRYFKTGSIVHTISRSTEVPTLLQSGFRFPFSNRLTLTTALGTLAANNYSSIVTTVEGQVIAPVHNKNITVSFWVRASRIGTYPLAFKNAANSRSYVSTYQINQADTWEKKSISIFLNTNIGSWDSGIGSGLQVFFTLASGSTFHAPSLNTWVDGNFISHSSCVNGVSGVADTGSQGFYITGIQLEEGTSASNFERAGGNIITELELCQRYFEKSYNINAIVGSADINSANYYVAASASFEHTNVFFKTRKRSSLPQVRYYSPVTGTIDRHRDFTTASDVTVTSSVIGDTNATFTFAVAPTTGRQYGFHWTADAEL